MSKRYYCSFCGVDDLHCEVMLRGPGVFICDGCVEQANAEIAKRAAAKHPRLRPKLISTEPPISPRTVDAL